MEEREDMMAGVILVIAGTLLLIAGTSRRPAPQPVRIDRRKRR